VKNLDSKVIWLICKYASPIKYYFGTRHFYLGEEWVKKGNKVYIFTSNSNHLTKSLPSFKGKSFKEDINGIDTIWLNTFKSKTNNGFSRIVSWFHFEWQVLTVSKKKFHKPDVIIVSSLSLLSVVSGLILSKRYKAKFILEIRDIWPLSIIELGHYSKWHPFILFLSWVEKLGYKKADVIVGTMPNLEEHVKNKIKSYKKVVCVPQGINLDFYKNKSFLSDHFMDEVFTKIKGKFIVAYIGTINPNNPIDLLLEAAEILKKRTDIFFLILGDGSRRNFLKVKYSNLNNVKFIDPINKSLVNHFLQNVSVCFDSLDSSIAKYGLSRNKWIDYMYAAKPIICSFSGFQSMINEVNAGSFVPYGDAKALAMEIEKYAAMDKIDLQRMGQRGHDYIISNRNFSKLALDYLKLMD